MVPHSLVHQRPGAAVRIDGHPADRIDRGLITGSIRRHRGEQANRLTDVAQPASAAVLKLYAIQRAGGVAGRLAEEDLAAGGKRVLEAVSNHAIAARP